ncbi:MAG TPA: hypothetical protein VIO61_11605 [Anaerolineaceae bacterium]
MAEIKRFSMVKPSLQTPFHIDFDWWKQHDNNWRVFLYSCLCPEHQAAYANMNEDINIDWIDPITAEVRTLDGLQHVLIEHCARQPGFYSTNTTLVDGVFRVLLANGNAPLTIGEIAAKINRQPEMILRTLTGVQVYKGIKPCQI